MSRLAVTGLYRKFGQATAVDHIDFVVGEGEFLSLLGPSGCGKSTTLSAIAGHDRPDGGRIQLGERVFFDGAARIFLPAEARNCGLVFQSYALWPHMSVFDNVAFPLRLRKVPKKEIERRVGDILDLVEMGPFASRYPHQLSGGQQQRVALARTLVYEPELLLLDEPLSNLDAKLRERARSWLARLRTQLGITTIYVTHDQSEAMALSDRIAVMSEGKIVQLATPKEIFERPAHPFVADFTGASNFLRGQVANVTAEGSITIRLPDGQSILVSTPRPFTTGSDVIVAVRPDRLRLLQDYDPREIVEGGSILRAEVRGRTYLGGRYLYEVDVVGEQARVEAPEDFTGPHLTMVVPVNGCVVLPA